MTGKDLIDRARLIFEAIPPEIPDRGIAMIAVTKEEGNYTLGDVFMMPEPPSPQLVLIVMKQLYPDNADGLLACFDSWGYAKPIRDKVAAWIIENKCSVQDALSHFNLPMPSDCTGDDRVEATQYYCVTKDGEFLAAVQERAVMDSIEYYDASETDDPLCPIDPNISDSLRRIVERV